MTDQPFELTRIIKFFVICIYIAIISESLGFVISSQLNVVVSNSNQFMIFIENKQFLIKYVKYIN